MLASGGAFVACLLFFASCSLPYLSAECQGQLGIIVLLENLNVCSTLCTCAGACAWCLVF